MSKKTNVIALEVEKYEAKIAEFQRYLEDHKNFDIADDRYKEIDIHIKIMNALPVWILALKDMKENASDKPVELKGGAVMNDAAKALMERKKQ